MKPLQSDTQSDLRIMLDWRLLDYGVPFTILMYGDCTSYNGRIREFLDYRGVGLAMFHCMSVNINISMNLHESKATFNNNLG